MLHPFINIHTHHKSDHPEVIDIQNHIIGKDLIFSNLYSAGIHPWYIDSLDSQLHTLEIQLKNEKCILLGECGLDKICTTDFDLQLDAFTKQIELANLYQKPIIIHNVKAHNEIINVKKKSKSNVAWIVHGFNNNENVLNEFLKNDCYISIGAAVLKESSNASKLLHRIPIDRLFIENDDINVDIRIIFAKISEKLEVKLDELKNQVFHNFEYITKHNK